MKFFKSKKAKNLLDAVARNESPEWLNDRANDRYSDYMYYMEDCDCRINEGHADGCKYKD